MPYEPPSSARRMRACRTAAQPITPVLLGVRGVVGTVYRGLRICLPVIRVGEDGGHGFVVSHCLAELHGHATALQRRQHDRFRKTRRH